MPAFTFRVTLPDRHPGEGRDPAFAVAVDCGSNGEGWAPAFAGATIVRVSEASASTDYGLASSFGECPKSMVVSAARYASTAYAATCWSSAAGSILSRVSLAVWWMSKYVVPSCASCAHGMPLA